MKFRADLLQLLYQFLEPGIAGIASTGSSKLHECRPGNHFPIGTFPHRQTGEESLDQVTPNG